MTNNGGQVSMQDYMASKGVKTKTIAGEFPPIADFKEAGEYFVGEYQGSRQVSFNNRVFTTHVFFLDQWTVTFLREKKIVEVKDGDSVSVSGAVIDEALKNVNVGVMVGVEFLGLGNNKKGNSPRLFRVEAVVTA